ncbi:MAG: hypothetical protein ACK5LX_04720 [Oscillospiraceae bacterium]
MGLGSFGERIHCGTRVVDVYPVHHFPDNLVGILINHRNPDTFISIIPAMTASSSFHATASAAIHISIGGMSGKREGEKQCQAHKPGEYFLSHLVPPKEKDTSTGVLLDY